MDARIEIDALKLGFGDVGFLFGRHASQAMHDDLLEIHSIGADIEEPHEKILPIGRAGYGNLSVAANDDGVAVVAVMAPAPERGLAHEHERRNLVESSCSSSRS
jgi:hypothetical protein